MTIIIPCSLGNGYCTFGFQIFIIDERNFLYYSLYILTEKIIKTPLLHQSLGPRVCLSFFLSLSLRLILWSAETRLAHSPARPSKTLSRRHPVPSPLLERAPGAFVRDAGPVSRTLLVFCVNQGVSASFFLSLSYRRLWTSRSRSIKEPQQPVITSLYVLHSLDCSEMFTELYREEKKEEIGRAHV